MDFSQLCTSQFSPKSQFKLEPNATLALMKSNVQANSGILRQYAGDINGAYYQYPSGGRQACMSSKTTQNDFRYK